MRRGDGRVSEESGFEGLAGGDGDHLNAAEAWEIAEHAGSSTPVEIFEGPAGAAWAGRDQDPIGTTVGGVRGGGRGSQVPWAKGSEDQDDQRRMGTEQADQRVHAKPI